MSRLVANAGQRVLRLGAGRSTRYTLAVELFGVEGEIGLFEIDEAGIVHEFASLRRAATGAYVVSGRDLPFWALGASGDGVFGDLPYFLVDLRPAGFLGRLAARQVGPELGAPNDPRDWTSEQIGRYLMRSGADLPGNVVLGERAAETANRATFTEVRDRGTRYPELVQRNLNEENPGSSAQGEQPKFLAHAEKAGHVIVKYTEPLDAAAGRRWADLLVAEEHALRILGENDFATAEAQTFHFGDRVYLESRRFDRSGRRGRRPAFSLGLVDAEYAGSGSGWSRMAAGLRAASLLDETSYRQVVWLETFGHWIGNTDMHSGNVSLQPLTASFALCPVYDMLPMRLARPTEALATTDLAPPIRRPANEAIWEDAARVAQTYWERLGDEASVSDEFRRFAARHAERCGTLVAS